MAIYPPTFRTKMAELWSIPEIQHWWLPGDEGYPAIIRSIRGFIEERAGQPQDHRGEDLRDMKAIFSKLNLDENSRQKSSPSGSGGNFEPSPPPNQSPTTLQQGQGSGDESSLQLFGMMDAQFQTGKGSGVGGSSGSHRPGDRMSGIWDGGYVP